MRKKTNRGGVPVRRPKRPTRAAGVDPWRRLLAAVALRVIDDLTGRNYTTAQIQAQARWFIADREGRAFVAAALGVASWRVDEMVKSLEIKELNEKDLKQ